MTFEEYLAQGVDAGQMEFRLVPVVMGGTGRNQQVTFYIHPLGKNGATHDYLVKGNDLIRVQSALEGTVRPVDEPQTITPAEAEAA